MIPRSFLGMVEVNEKVPDRCGGRGEGDGDRPLLLTNLNFHHAQKCK